MLSFSSIHCIYGNTHHLYISIKYIFFFFNFSTACQATSLTWTTYLDATTHIVRDLFVRINFSNNIWGAINVPPKNAGSIIICTSRKRIKCFTDSSYLAYRYMFMQFIYKQFTLYRPIRIRISNVRFMVKFAASANKLRSFKNKQNIHSNED